jgi:hypothetical protein
VGLILKYGAYAHDAGEVSIVISKRANESETGVRISFTETWTITGRLHGTDINDLTAKIILLAAAYSINGYDLGLYQSDGTTLTSHVMLSSQARGGVRIMSFGFPEGDGAEYTTYRTFSITAEAEFPVGNAGIIAYQETLTLIGGGPKFVFLQTLAGPPQRQQVAQATPYRATQQGSSTGDVAYPTENPPLFPADEHRDRRSIARVTPTIRLRTFTNYTVTWSYEFESASPLIGAPATF